MSRGFPIAAIIKAIRDRNLVNFGIYIEEQYTKQQNKCVRGRAEVLPVSRSYLHLFRQM